MNTYARAGLAALMISATPAVAFAQEADTTQVRTVENEEGFDLGWLGLLGLAGLLGLRRKEPVVHHTTTTTDRDRVSPRV